jgi:transposase
MTIPNETHARIVGMCQGGMKGVEIADKVGVLVRTVQRIVKQFKEDGNFKSHTSRGRPKLLSERDVWNIVLFSRSNHRASLIEITNACQ